MKMNDVFQQIIDSDPQEHWRRMEHKGQRAIFKDDVNIRIECDLDKDLLVQDFTEDWANKHSDPHAVSYSYNIFYGASLVAFVVLVSVDGCRALLPVPDRKTMVPDLLAFRIAEIFDIGTFHEYMKRAGLNYPTGA